MRLCSCWDGVFWWCCCFFCFIWWRLLYCWLLCEWVCWLVCCSWYCSEGGVFWGWGESVGCWIGRWFVRIWEVSVGIVCVGDVFWCCSSWDFWSERFWWVGFDLYMMLWVFGWCGWICFWCRCFCRWCGRNYWCVGCVWSWDFIVVC